MILPELKTSETDFESRFDAGQGLASQEVQTTRKRVFEIVDTVRNCGDDALLDYTERFDGVKLAPERMRVSEDEIDAAFAAVPRELTEALETAAQRICDFQKSILLADPDPLRKEGRQLSLHYSPVESAGICVPGASASLASSVLMNVIPAAVAGVERICMITPPERDGTVSADRLAAARIAGATEIYRVFGAQAVAALAFGTETIKPVDYIAGPGNVYVASAKKAVFGHVGIDMIAGPSEVVVIADETANARWVAAELLAQAEHTRGSATLLTDSANLAEDTRAELEEQAATLPRSEDIQRCLEEFGAIILTQNTIESVALSNRIAPEHLVIMSDNAEDICEDVRHAGAIFLGHFTPVAVGDYIAGPSHTLPTGGTARFSSGLTANHFMKSSSVVRYDRDSLVEDAPKLTRIAEAEQLNAHAGSVLARIEEED